MASSKLPYTPFTYLIGWSKLNLWYYGSRYTIRENAHPSDLWNLYFTSSQNVNLLREQYGEPDVIQIRKTFSTPEDTIKWEQKVLKRLNVRDDPKWLNKTNGGGFPDNTGKIRTSEQRQHMSEARRRFLARGGKVWNAGTAISHEEKLRRRRKPKRKIVRSLEERQNLSEKIKNLPKKACSYCGKKVPPSHLVRWHEENCKFKGKSFHAFVEK